MSQELELFLFSVNPGLVRAASEAGVDGIVVDWENRGKEGRQENRDTQVNYDTPEDLARVRSATTKPVICRINGYGEWTGREVEEAVSRGAGEILLPMVRRAAEVEAVLRLARGRCGVGILVETVSGVACAASLGRLPLSRVYVGLNDLAIERGCANIFESVVDGTVERVRPHFRAPFGFGGATLPEAGSPIPCRLLLGEMARLNCSFTFLRRSFLRDVRGRDLAVELPRIRQASREAFRRPDESVRSDRERLRRAVAGWEVADEGAGDVSAVGRAL